VIGGGMRRPAIAQTRGRERERERVRGREVISGRYRENRAFLRGPMKISGVS
jgi:hypothetical protein